MADENTNTPVPAVITPKPSNPPRLSSAPTKEALSINFDLSSMAEMEDAGETKVVSATVPVTVDDKPAVKVPDNVIELPEEEKPVEVKVDKKEEKGIERFLKPPVKEGERKVETKVETGQIQVPAKKDEVDISSYGDEAGSYLKQMSNPAKKYVTELIKRAKTAEESAKQLYLQHEGAYRLDPEYENLSMRVNRDKFEAQHYITQLELAKLGKPITALNSWADDGKPVFSGDIQSNSKIEETLRIAVSKALGAAEQNESKLRSFSGNYKTRVSQDLQAIDKFAKEKFQWENQPELLDHSMMVQGQGDRKIRDIIGDVTSLFPAYLRNHPAVRMCGNMMVGLILKDAQISELSATKQVVDVKLEESSRVEPNSHVRYPASNSKNARGIPSIFNADLISEQ